MRMILGLLALSVFSAPALADVKSYCEVFGQDFATAKTSDVDEWQLSYRSAFSNCMAQYTSEPKPVAPKKTVEKASKKVVVVPVTSTSTKKRTRILAPGSNAWVAACAAKYASFDSGTGNYRSRTGKLRRCSV